MPLCLVPFGVFAVTWQMVLNVSHKIAAHLVAAADGTQVIGGAECVLVQTSVPYHLCVRPDGHGVDISECPKEA